MQMTDKQITLTSSELVSDKGSASVSDDNSLSGSLLREARLLTYGTGQGLSEQAGLAFNSDNIGGTTLKFAGAVALGAAITCLSRGSGLSQVLGRAAGTTMSLGFVADMANPERLSVLGNAMSDTWQSGANFDRNLATVKPLMGSLAVDLTIMGAGGALGAWGVKSGVFPAAAERAGIALSNQANIMSMAAESLLPSPQLALATNGPRFSRPVPEFSRPVPEYAMAMSSMGQRGGFVPPHLSEAIARGRAVKAEGAKLVEYEALPEALRESKKLDNGIPGQDKVAPLLQELFKAKAKSGMRIEVVEIPAGSVGDRAFKTDALFVVVQPNGKASNAWPVDFSFAHKEFLPHVFKLDKSWFLYEAETGALATMINQKPVHDAVWARAMQFMRKPELMQTFKTPVPIETLQQNRANLRFSLENSIPRLNF